ncbi:glycosyltransferase family 39 protein [Nocardia sp. BMG111209]|uniref:glycosyltransferase family 39 protein n=1 Tax=Nocardia sp. BMG111209 TaxID=1160137 RepID=UPI0003782998|nr:glycosyltransferase family 39 protein [Nocardia sp. BMG111209]
MALIAGVTALVLLVRSARYDYFGDELYFLAAGRHLQAGYADQGPLIPLLARLAAAVDPGSLVLLRLPAILAAVAGVVLAAATARELGGRRRAQWLAAAGYATSPYLITQAASLSTFALDSTAGAAVIWLLVRWTRVRRDRLLVAAAIVVAIDVQVKLLILVLVAALVAAATAIGPRDLLRRSAFWAGVAIVLVAAIPGVEWQRRHGWPQLAMGAIIRTEQRAATGGVAGLPVQWAILTGLLGGLLALLGLWALLWRNDFRPYRFLGIATLLQTLFVIAVGGRPYYLTACFPVLFAAGAVAATVLWPGATRSTSAPARRRTHRRPADMVAAATTRRATSMEAPKALSRRTIRITGVAVVAISVAIAATVVTLLPQPISRLRQPTDTQAELSARMRTFGTTGWSGLVGAVDRAYAELPPADRDTAVVVAQTYWQAAAIDVLGTRPPVYSPNRGYAYFGAPPDDTRTVLYVTAGDAAGLDTAFESVRPVARLDDPLGFPGIDRGVTVWRCDRPRRPWPVLWRDRSTLVLDPGLRSVPNSPAPERYSS